MCELVGERAGRLIMGMMSLPSSVVAGSRLAFVVGIETYDQLPSHQQLKNAVNDAEGVSLKLAEIGFQVMGEPNLTRSAFNT